MLACALCIGSSPEPYLEATLASIAPVVDLLVVNDNSGISGGTNRRTLESSAFARDGRMAVVTTRFVDFATMRNDAFAALAARAAPDWVFWLDADEVHTEEIVNLAHFLLPRLGPEYGSVDGYTDHFLGSFRWISDVARRLCAYRFDPALHWQGAVHEKVHGLSGKALVLPYRYAHYGNVLPPELYAAKDLRYLSLGNVVDYVPPEVADATFENIYARKGRGARRFRGEHPAAARPLLARLEREWGESFQRIDEMFSSAQRPADRVRNALAGGIEETRIALRRLATSRLPTA
jgi:hypothetical protein